MAVLTLLYIDDKFFVNALIIRLNKSKNAKYTAV